MKRTLRYQHHDLALPEGEFIIGRAETCQLSLDDPLVSRNHARLRVLPERVLLDDLASRNGVRVNGHTIEGTRELRDGDQVLIGIQELTLVMRAEQLDVEAAQQPSVPKSNTFGLLGLLADKALALGRAEDAERLIGLQLDQFLVGVQGGDPASDETLELASSYALRIANAMGSARWADYVFRLYSARSKPCPAALIDELYEVMRRVRQPSASGLRDYLGVLRQLQLGPTERFLMHRLEGLERVISSR